MTHWTQRDGTKIALSDMTALHLRHSFRMVSRLLAKATFEAEACWATDTRGEAATYYADGARVEAGAKVLRLSHLLVGLHAELKRRRRALTAN